MERKKRQLEYKWVIACVCFMTVFVCLGFCSSNKALYLAAITEALGIKRSLFSFNDSIRFISTAVVNLFFGSLVSRFGTKKMILFGVCALIGAVLVYAHAETVGLFYLGGCLLGIGLAFTTTTMVGCVIRRWFREHGGKITGFVLAANGLGGAAAAQIVSPIIYEEGNPFGYRNAYKLVAVILLILLAVLLVLFRERESTGEGEKTKGRPAAKANPVKGTPWFYAVAGCVFLTGLVLQGIEGISAAHLKDVGLDTEFIANVLGVHALALALFKFLTGIFYDRFGIGRTVLCCDIAAVAVTFVLALVQSSPAGMVLAMVYGIFSSLALPLETVLIPLFTGELFGNGDFDRMLGILVAVNTAGYAVGTPLVNWCYDMTGSYTPILYVLGFVMLGVTVCMQLAIRRGTGKQNAEDLR